MTAKDRLERFLKGYPQKFIRTSTILDWGVKCYSNRAGRNARNLCELGKLRRLTREESILNGYKTSEGIYEICF